MQIVIEGIPIARARPRIVRRGVHSIAYDPQQKQKEEFINKLNHAITDVLSKCSKEEFEEVSNFMYGESFSLDIESYMPIPKSLSNRKRMALEGALHNKKPDGDNIFKGVADFCNGILYSDDSKIVKGSFVKKYSNNPRTVINIKAINLNGDIS